MRTLEELNLPRLHRGHPSLAYSSLEGSGAWYAILPIAPLFHVRPHDVAHSQHPLQSPCTRNLIPMRLTSRASRPMTGIML